jgi:hypothetical protein
MIPGKFAPLLFGLILSGLMSFVVSGVATLRALGMGPGFAGIWIGAWLAAWLIAFPIVLVAAPLVRRVVQYLVGPHAAERVQAPDRGRN